MLGRVAFVGRRSTSWGVVGVVVDMAGATGSGSVANGAVSVAPQRVAAPVQPLHGNTAFGGQAPFSWTFRRWSSSNSNGDDSSTSSPPVSGLGGLGVDGDGELFGDDANDGDTSVVGEDLFGDEAEAEELQYAALKEGEEQATQAVLEDAGVHFTEQESRRLDSKMKEFYEAAGRRVDGDVHASPLSVSQMAVLDDYTEFKVDRDAFYTDPSWEFDWSKKGQVITDDDMTVRRRGGVQQLFCIFCYYGTEMLRPDNTTLLNKFISESGKIVPRRTSYLCAKHQRQLRSTVKRARKMQLLPYKSRLHPKLRATRLMPDPDTHKPVTFTTPRHAFLAAQKYDKLVTQHRFAAEWPTEEPQVDWFPEDE